MPRNEISAHQVILVRHGQTALNAAGRLRGRLDPPLSAIGAQEVQGLTDALIQWHPGRVVTGPLRRTLQTAELIGLATTNEPVVDADLQDRDYGVWAGHLKTEVLALWGCLDNAPDVEPADEVRVRALRALNNQIPFLSAQPIVLVSHDAIITHLLAELDPKLGSADGIMLRTASFSTLVYEANREWSVQLVNQAASTEGRPGSGQINTGAPACGEPIANYNRLLAIADDHHRLARCSPDLQGKPGPAPQRPC